MTCAFACRTGTKFLPHVKNSSNSSHPRKTGTNSSHKKHRHQLQKREESSLSHQYIRSILVNILSVSPGISVLELKQVLQDQVSIPVEQQKLIFQGKQLADDKSLSHYKVEDGAKLFLMLKKPGSGATPSTSSTPSSVKSTPQTPSTFPKGSEQETVPFRIEHDRTGFWEKLSTFLKRHFTEKDALKVLQEFKKDFDNGMRNMSLDDIERLAAARLRITEGYFHEKKIR